MEFHDKLIFLMNITQTTNKELAAALSVDPSLISLFRSGKRKRPQNPDYYTNMAAFFSRRCPAAFQRNALSEMLGQSSIGISMPTEELAESLTVWLSEGSEITANLFSTMNRPVSPTPAPKEPPSAAALSGLMTEQPSCSSKDPSPGSLSRGQSAFYIGEMGRRAAVRQIMEQILSSPTPGTIYVSSDDNLEWLLSDYSLTGQIQALMQMLLERGFTLCQVMPPVNYLPRFAESLKFWLPVYSSGKVSVYYYPRMRDNLYRRSLILFPGHCVRVSNALGLDSDSDITLFSTEKTIVDAYLTQFQELLSMCRPAITGHTGLQEFAHLYGSLMSRMENLISMTSFLSPCTIPGELFDILLQTVTNEKWRNIFRENRVQFASFSDLMETRKYIDMAYLATAEEVRDGKVYVGCPFSLDTDSPVYTPKTYILHLRNILRLMDTNENYCFVPLGRNQLEGFELFVNSDGLALLNRSTPPALMLELQRPELVISCQEYLLHKAETIGYNGIHKETTRKQILKLIKELS